ncbi:dehydratase [Saccharospirillum sp. MSK14-1]|uniref:MaoC family dehydratase n=1 Tax=Saccharospirillum sp. MSK14-1 TaxID=1897632 RepID=UPI000D3800B6|nr:MaoC family dehydratase [Saccharospirillum sp. MSK14-1]PTY36999.1 dehydratase [Saccharospirillum sp. MSK14-1]
MNVIDMLKEKTERLTRNQAEFRDLIAPQWREYWSELWQSARNYQWVNWILDSDHRSLDETETQPSCDSPEAEMMRQQLMAQMDSVVYVGEWMTVEQERINQFAEVTEDRQWIHTDPERAAEESPFKAAIAHGFLTLSLIPRLTNAVDPENPPYKGAKMVVNMGLNQVRFPFPLKAGSRVRGSKKIVGVKIVRRGLEVTEEITVEIENMRRPACVAQTVIRLVY